MISRWQKLLSTMEIKSGQCMLFAISTIYAGSNYAADCNLDGYCVAHTANAVLALHKREEPEGPHDVILNFCERAKRYISVHT